MPASTDISVVASEHGARGDGSTDDTAALRAALTAAGTGTLRLTAGATYVVSATLVVDGPTLDGAGATITPAPGIPAPVVLSFGPRGGTVRDLTVDLARSRTRPSGAPGGGAGIWTVLGRWAPITVERVTVRDGHGFGIGFSNWQDFPDAAVVPGRPTVLRDVTVTGCRYGINLTKLGTTWLERVRVGGSQGTGILVDRCRATHLRDCSSNGSTGGTGYFVMYSRDTVVERCEATGNHSHGIAMGGGSTILPASRNFTISGGRFAQNGDCGITVDLTRDGRENQYVVVRADGGITGNEVRDNGRAGIQIEFSSHLTLTGNTSTGNGRARQNVGSGIRATGGNLVIDGNTLTGNAAYGLALYWDPAHTGVGNHRIGTNVCAPNGQGTIYIPPGMGVNPQVLAGTQFAPRPDSGTA